jgi:hypothetical protein
VRYFHIKSVISGFIVSSESYESHLVGLFMQLWGRQEGVCSEPATLLNNAQNPFDHWFGDICGQVQYRYFLIEFKRSRDGFFDEVKVGSAKPHRTSFYQHLRTDEACRQISRIGHFAAYQADNDLLAFEPYAHSVVPKASKKDVVKSVLSSSAPYCELDYQAWTFGFLRFYNELHESDLSLHHQSSPTLFGKGLGIPELALEQYVSCMYSHVEDGTTDSGLILLGAFNLSTGKLKALALPPFKMVVALKEKFALMRVAMAAELASEKSREDSLGNDY